MDWSAVARRVWELAEPVVATAGLELVDVQYRPEGGRTVLRLLIDRPMGGVTIDELARISREIGLLLDAHDAVPGRYISNARRAESPAGQAEHFQRAIARVHPLRTPRGPALFRGALAAAAENAHVETSTSVPGAAARRRRARQRRVRLQPPAMRRARLGGRRNDAPDLNRHRQVIRRRDRSPDRRALEQALSAAKRTFDPDKNTEAKFNPKSARSSLRDRAVARDEVVENDAVATRGRIPDPEAQVGDELFRKLPAEKLGRSPRRPHEHHPARARRRARQHYGASSARGRASSPPAPCKLREEEPIRTRPR